MARWSAVVAVSLAASIAGCEGEVDADVDPSLDPLRREWSACFSDAAGDYRRTVYFYPDSYSSTTRTYSTSDGTCGGAETGSSMEIWRFRLAAEVPARIASESGPEVVAREMNVQNSAETVFTIVYVDAQAVPPRLYLGDVELDPLEDGTSVEKRPDVLSASTVLVGE